MGESYEMVSARARGLPRSERDFLSPKRLAAGTSVERARSARGVRHYASKSNEGMPQGREHVGKFWGAIGRKNLPLSQCETMTENRQVMIRVRRIVRRFMHSKGLRRGRKGSVRLYTEQYLQRGRVLDWARTGDCQPIDFAALLASQPF